MIDLDYWVIYYPNKKLYKVFCNGSLMLESEDFGKIRSYLLIRNEKIELNL